MMCFFGGGGVGALVQKIDRKWQRDRGWHAAKSQGLELNCWPLQQGLCLYSLFHSNGRRIWTHKPPSWVTYFVYITSVGCIISWLYHHKIKSELQELIKTVFPLSIYLFPFQRHLFIQFPVTFTVTFRSSSHSNGWTCLEKSKSYKSFIVI